MDDKGRRKKGKEGRRREVYVSRALPSHATLYCTCCTVQNTENKNENQNRMGNVVYVCCLWSGEAVEPGNVDVEINPTVSDFSTHLYGTLFFRYKITRLKNCI